MAEKRKKDPFSHAWLKWLILGVFAYAFYMHYTGKVDNIPSTTGHRDKTPSLLNRAARPVTPLPDIPDQGIKVLGDIAGQGRDTAQCGQVADIRVEGTLPNGTPVSGLPEKTITVQIGAYGQTDSWKAALVGMKPGGIRQITLPLSRLAEAPEDGSPEGSATFKLHMESLTPSAVAEEVPFFAIETAAGGAGIAYCGDEATIALTLYGPDGAPVFETEQDKPLTFRIGSGTYLYGLDRGMMGMHESSSRLIVIPPAYAVSLAEKSGEAADGFDALQGKMLVAEVRLLALKKGASE